MSDVAILVGLGLVLLVGAIFGAVRYLSRNEHLDERQVEGLNQPFNSRVGRGGGT